MCNLYFITTSQAAIRQLARAMEDHTGQSLATDFSAMSDFT